MERAVILIGVKRAGSLPPLRAVETAVSRFKKWARSQKLDEDRIREVTDSEAPVTIERIKAAVNYFREHPAGIEQLLVYFSGHGVSNHYQEYWLLSNAPEDGDEAVNLESNITLARRCPFKHVVFISDACRSAAAGVQGQAVRGSNIFPNLPPSGGPENPVDVFFACGLGAPAYEIGDEEKGTYSAVYTTVLAEALEGGTPSLAPDGFVRPHPLGRYMRPAVLKRLRMIKAPLTASQSPDARITSDETAWLSQIDLPLASVEPVDADATAGTDADDRNLPTPPLQAALEAFRSALNADPENQTFAVGRFMKLIKRPDVEQHLSPPIETKAKPIHAESHIDAGFRLMGAQLRNVTFDQSEIEVHEYPGGLVGWVMPVSDNPGCALLELETGSGLLLPILRGYIASIAVSEGLVQRVWYEPADDWAAKSSRRELWNLRTLIGEAASQGVFRLDAQEAPKLIERMRHNKFLDPALSLYAAYAYREIGRTADIADMRRYVRNDTGCELFDLVLLSGGFLSHADQPSVPIASFTPLLAQGWALLSAYGIRMVGPLRELPSHVLPSLWTTFNREGVALVRWALQSSNKRYETAIAEQTHATIGAST